ncbi:hypothetical protein GF373_13540 [bacterium]|nr:hypothetical protein [bacterium]
MCAEPIRPCEIADLFEKSCQTSLKNSNMDQAHELCRKSIELCESCAAQKHCLIPKLCNLALINLSRGHFEEVSRNLDRVKEAIQQPQTP